MVWHKVSLESVTTPCSTWSPSKDVRESISYVDVSSVDNDLAKISSAQKYNAKEAPGRARKIINEGDTIFATIRPGLRRIAKVPPSLDNEIASTAFCVLRPNRTIIDPDFLFFAVQTDAFVNSVVQHERGSSYPAVTDKVVLMQTIPFPPLDVQRAIAVKLRILRDAIEAESNLLRVTHELKQAALEKLFSEGLRAEQQKETEVGLVPKSWTVINLEDVCSFTTGKLNSNAAVADGSYPFFTCSRETFKINCFSFDQEAILLSGNNAQGVYSVKYYKGKFDAYQRTYVFTIKDINSYDYQFLHFELSRQLALLQASSLGTVTKYLTSSILRSLKLVAPLIAEQRQIGSMLRSIDHQSELIESKLEVLHKLFCGALVGLMSGDFVLDQPIYRNVSDPVGFVSDNHFTINS